MPPALQSEPEIVKAITKLDRMYFEEKEREIYEAELKARLDGIEEMRTAMEKGRSTGRAEGEAIGIEKGKAIGRAEGEAIGRTEGEAIGRTEGEAIGIARALQRLLENGTPESEARRLLGIE